MRPDFVMAAGELAQRDAGGHACNNDRSREVADVTRRS